MPEDFEPREAWIEEHERESNMLVGNQVAAGDYEFAAILTRRCASSCGSNNIRPRTRAVLRANLCSEKKPGVLPNRTRFNQLKWAIGSYGILVTEGSPHWSQHSESTGSKITVRATLDEDDRSVALLREFLLELTRRQTFWELLPDHLDCIARSATFIIQVALGFDEQWDLLDGVPSLSEEELLFLLPRVGSVIDEALVILSMQLTDS